MTQPSPAVPSRRSWIIGSAVALFAVGGAVGVAGALRIAGWEKVDRPGGLAYLVPGHGGAVVDARTVPLLAVLGGGALLFALALACTAWGLSQAIARGHRAAPLPPREAAIPRARPARLRFAVIGPVLLLAVLGGFGVRWYAYVTNTATPFDEVGIGLNARAPGPLRAWGCGRLKATFGTATLPPSGCGREDDASRWR